MKQPYSVIAFAIMMIYSMGHLQTYDMFTPVILNERFVPQSYELNHNTDELINLNLDSDVYILINT